MLWSTWIADAITYLSNKLTPEQCPSDDPLFEKLFALREVCFQIEVHIPNETRSGPRFPRQIISGLTVLASRASNLYGDAALRPAIRDIHGCRNQITKSINQLFPETLPKGETK
jgi:hypothetical protein